MMRSRKPLWQDTGIGGYFELECPLRNGVLAGYTYQSARAALASLMLQSGIKRVWVPYFLCETIADELRRVGLEVERYSLEPDLAPSASLTVAEDEAALIVNYFGVCSQQVERAICRLPHDRCVVDNSHAWGEPASNCLGTIYSARKFFGVPDGGLLVTERDIQEPVNCDDQSLERCRHLLMRLDGPPESGRDAYRRAEETLIGVEHRRMSTLTQRLLASINQADALSRRRANFRAMNDFFSEINEFPCIDKKPASPLTYPLMLSGDASDLRSALIERRVFSPTYWPELLEGIADEQATYLASQIVHLPIDQRYDPAQLLQRLQCVEMLMELRTDGVGNVE